MDEIMSTCNVTILFFLLINVYSLSTIQIINPLKKNNKINKLT
jgi:hypothetical protein